MPGSKGLANPFVAYLLAIANQQLVGRGEGGGPSAKW